MKKKLIIIGAGLSGLYTAFLLQDAYEITILEARDRIGGRVFGIGEHDMGPSWVWSHQKNILSLVQQLGLELFTQHTQGLALYDTPTGVQRFTPPPQAPSARIVGGISALINAIYKQLNPQCVHLNEVVTSLKETNEGLVVTTQTQSFTADKVISTLPPRLAVQNISYTPDLDAKLKQQMQNIPTWMGHSAKCVIEYKTPFWKEEGLSGFAFSPLGPLSEIHDACTANHAAVFGFVHTKVQSEDIKKDITAQLVRLFGKQADAFTAIHLMDWKKEPFSATIEDAKGLSSHPDYGLDGSHFKGKLYFRGTETSFTEGGYLEGALISAKNIADTLRAY